MPELEEKTFQKRQVAYKARILDIASCNFAKDELSAGYIKLRGINVSRVNIIATVVYKHEQALGYNIAVIDDGTGRIPLRIFDNNNTFSKVDVGDVVLVIGRIREFDNEKYVIPEILKKINNVDWASVRKLELGNHNPVVDESVKTADKNIAGKAAYNVTVDEEISLLIKKLDKGDGAFVEDVIKNFNNAGAEGIINKLLENGEVFEIKPGRLKVLE